MSRVNITSSVPTLHVFCKQLYSVVAQKTRRALGRAHLPPTKVFRQLSERNHFITTARSSGGAPYVGFPRRKILRSSAAQLAGSLGKSANFRSLYRRKQSGLWSESGSKVNQFVHVPTSATRNISSKYIHAFLSNLANRQTDRQTRAKTCTSFFVGGNYV